ncbi:alpha/beta hydrolase family protein [Dactylosporangium siamense]|uniref:Alpha/beta hydrolase n=1 Tax=Dactylosporangium siamense TaxID=685454 RepID=A0A919PLV6_9ACTN|nr:chlorophyllase [Dactylosporangium siamense]GIG46159.1 alpha/beta hydrolase [Dactylosporangium siamense]
MRRRSAALPTLLLALALALVSGVSGCTGQPSPARWVTPSPSLPGGAAPRLAQVTPLSPLPVPTAALDVSRQEITYQREGRVLRTVIWMPSTSAKVPAVVFSHGLNGTPESFAPLLTAWAAAGFAVIAPAYPNTTRSAPRLDVYDVLNQPADASFVLSQVLAGPLGKHIDSDRLAAAGHSAGAITTVGLFTAGRDARLHAGIILAGSGLGVGTAFSGTPASLLFVHGDADPLVSYASGKATYDVVPWSKAMLTVPGGNHNDPYLRPGVSSFTEVQSLTIAFLRLELYGDASARRKLPRGPSFDDQL